MKKRNILVSLIILILIIVIVGVIFDAIQLLAKALVFILGAIIIIAFIAKVFAMVKSLISTYLSNRKN